MEKLILSTDNTHKVIEIKEALEGLPLLIQGKSSLLQEPLEVEENLDTLEGNAGLKARALAEKLPGHYILADDTGLFVSSLNGEPGVHSARYGGDHDDRKNNLKLLENLKDQEDRSAYFKTVLFLIDPSGKEVILEGICPGKILKDFQGQEAFGYDPLFLPDNFQKSFAQMTTEEKNAISHRGRALAKLRDYLEETLGEK